MNIKKGFAPLEVTSIEKEIEPFLSDKVKFFWKNIIEDQGKDEDDKLHACCLQNVVSKPILNFENIPDAYDEDYKNFAEMINKAADMNLIHTGVLSAPAKFQLSYVNMEARYILFFHPFTKIKNSKLIAISKLFTNEGALGDKAEDINL